MLNMPPLVVVVPAAGVGKRMQASCPKQYLPIQQKSILTHTVMRLASHSNINQIIIALSKGDEYFSDTELSSHPKVQVVEGGNERVDSVLAGLKIINADQFPWVLVHDAARPCLTLADLDSLIGSCINNNTGGILAAPVRDTMKRSTQQFVENTVERENLWHALTPQMFPTKELEAAINSALEAGASITDEASAIEFVSGKCLLVEGSSENIKITHPDDLAFAEFILSKQKMIDKELDK